MTFRFVCYVFILVSVHVIAQDDIKEKYNCGIQSSKDNAPWLVGIESPFEIFRTSKIILTGALISRRHVISVTSLYTIWKPEAVYIGFDNIEACAVKGRSKNCAIDINRRITVEDITTQTTDVSNNNIWLIILSEKVQYTDLIRPICLPNADILPDAIGRELQFTGIHLDKRKHQKFNTVMTILDKVECKNSFNNKTRSVVCAKNADGTKSCPLYGGLLINKREGVYELIGLLQKDHCNETKLFSNLLFSLSWIRSTIPEDSYDSDTTEPMRNIPFLTSDGCGRRKVEHIKLTMKEEAKKDTGPSDWPWHVAIYRPNGLYRKYTCGGTLISKTMVLTAAHCTIENGLPIVANNLNVYLGKYDLVGSGLESQQREVYSVIVHEDFMPKNYLENDIALLKMRTEATYNDYVQPACIWSKKIYDHLYGNNVFGMEFYVNHVTDWYLKTLTLRSTIRCDLSGKQFMVVGWDYDHQDAFSSQLIQRNMLKISDVKCVNKNQLFYANALGNEKKFCAGWANGTTACSIHSGGGFLVFVPDTTIASPDATGSWFIRGIASFNNALENSTRCDPDDYMVFTDIEKYTDWIRMHLNN